VTAVRITAAAKDSSFPFTKPKFQFRSPHSPQAYEAGASLKVRGVSPRNERKKRFEPAQAGAKFIGFAVNVLRLTVAIDVAR